MIESDLATAWRCGRRSEWCSERRVRRKPALPLFWSITAAPHPVRSSTRRCKRHVLIWPPSSSGGKRVWVRGTPSLTYSSGSDSPTLRQNRFVVVGNKGRAAEHALSRRRWAQRLEFRRTGGLVVFFRHVRSRDRCNRCNRTLNGSKRTGRTRAVLHRTSTQVTRTGTRGGTEHANG